MKKNKMMRLASILLIAVLLSTSVISGTYAKYVTSGSAADSARVAKFGVAINANGSLFAKEYATDDAEVAATIAKSVISVNTDKLVAPGTSGTMATSTVSGTPEVAVNVKREAVLELNGWTDGSGAYYCPIRITVGSNTYYGLDYPSAADFKTAVQNAIAADSKNYSPNKDLSTVGGDTLAVSWAWDFAGSDGKQTDVKDTFLGDQAADGNPSTILLSVVTTVTQIN